MPAFTNASNVRAYAGIDAINAQNDRWNEGPLSSNIRAASAFLEKRTGRQFELQLATTKTFTTNGEAFIAVPGMRNNNPTITLADTVLTVDTDAFLIPDHQQTGVYIGLQFRPFGSRADYRSWPNWFDTNLDRRWYPGYTSDPNDLTVRDDWGYVNYPEELIHVTNVLAVWFTKRPDASLSNTIQTPDGNVFDLSALPTEVQLFIAEWKIGNQIVAVG